MKNTPVFDQLIEHFGSPDGLAKALGIKRQAIYMWKGRVPPLRACQIEKITGGKFQAENLNPKADARNTA